MRERFHRLAHGGWEPSIQGKGHEQAAAEPVEHSELRAIDHGNARMRERLECVHADVPEIVIAGNEDDVLDATRCAELSIPRDEVRHGAVVDDERHVIFVMKHVAQDEHVARPVLPRPRQHLIEHVEEIRQTRIGPVGQDRGETWPSMTVKI